MSEAVVDPEALRGMRAALSEWAQTATGLVVQTGAATDALLANAERESRSRLARLRALEDALRAAPPKEQGPLADAVRQASASVERARAAVRLASEAVARGRALRRRVEQVANQAVPSANRDLERKLKALSDYAAAPVPAASGAPAAGGVANFGVPGLVDVPVDRMDFEDNPIRGDFGRGGAETGDYRWAVETWETVVRPGVLAGQSREDFAARDAARGREVGFRRTAGVYDMFLGDDPIAVSRRSDGSFSVNSGRHRIAIARQLGITHLPGKIHG